ncbi:MAG: hypothetical protein ACLQUY_23170 [Ktedonobacterales bacterium]
MSDEIAAELPSCVALTQEHRGHGVSTAAYYLGRVLIAQGLRVLLVDLTGRRAYLNALFGHGAVRNLVYWAPTLSHFQNITSLVQRAKRETAGRADVILLDVDAALLEHSGGFATGVDYVLAVTEATESGQQAAERIAERLGDSEPPHGRVGVCFSRIDSPAAAELPERTSHRHLPVIGYYPADYLLASGEDYSLKGGESSAPHDTYLYATLRLGQKLIQLVPLRRVSGLVNANNPLAAHHETSTR